MSTEREIQLNFLDEAEEHLHSIEANLLGLANNSVNTEQLDRMLRSAHSVKGGAAMMGLSILSQMAHRLEDFFKILRVRYASVSMNLEVESLMLRSIDCLRQVSHCYRQELPIEDSWLNEQAEPIFINLHQHLGDLQQADEDALMAQDEDVDPALLLFEEAVEVVLDRFEKNFEKLSQVELLRELVTTTKELINFGQMADLRAFTQLCQSIEQQAQDSPPAQVNLLAERALTVWRRSHALVMRGRLDQLPNNIDGVVSQELSADSSQAEIDTWSDLDVSELQAEFADFGDFTSEELSNQVREELVLDEDLIAEAFVDLDEPTDLRIAPVPEVFVFSDIELDQALIAENLSELQAAFKPEILATNVESPQTPLKELKSDPVASPSVGKMVRVPLEQLRRFNDFFERLIQERNKINLHLKQTQNLTTLMRQRMQQIEESNTQLQQWYDRASLEGLVNNTEPALVTFSSQSLAYRQEQFDALEMDRYSNLHLICQEQIETIVQLREVSTDIELEIQEMTQTVRSLNQTTKSLQGNVNRTQMLPFAEVVKRFPRVVRDLSMQFNKQVELKIAGENTLIDRSILETLGDPLVHLLRNAFDHGIEEPSKRLAMGKSPIGTISLKAINKGTQTLITISDDGGGIPLVKIRDRLRSLGLPEPQIQRMPESELLDYIFEPGFTTAESVTELSGRGVGMDVVRTNLNEIRGDIKVETREGLGTTFTLRIPFTLSILRVMIVEQSGFVFAISVGSVREIVPFQPEQLTKSAHLEHLNWHNQTIPFVRLEEHLDFPQAKHNFEMTGNPAINQPVVLIVGDDNQLASIHLSRFWNEQEATIRPIVSPIPLPWGLANSVILGDGRVIPLIEPLDMISECLKPKSEKGQTPTERPLVPSSAPTKTILVVDDSINVRRYLGFTLEKAGYKVEQAKDGREAVDKLTGGLSVAAVICDIEMPRLDGYGVLEELKGKLAFQKLPIAMLTSRSNEKHRKLAMNLGASAYFSKPYNEQELLDKLVELTS